MAGESGTPEIIKNLRRGERFEVTLPIVVEGERGWARNVSDMGICFDSGHTPSVGSIVKVTVEFTAAGELQRTEYEALVVRVDVHPTGAIVGARLRPPYFGARERVRSSALSPRTEDAVVTLPEPTPPLGPNGATEARHAVAAMA